MVAPRGVPSSAAMAGSSGRASAGSRASTSGSTRTAYKATGPSTTSGLDIRRRVQRQRGARIIGSQKGKTSREPKANSCDMTDLQEGMMTA
jgi:hypothetical protein